MIIRRETESDYDKIYKLVKSAFATTGYSDGTEADRVNLNRTRPYYVPELSLVFEEYEKIIGYIALHEMEIKYANHLDTQLEVAPLAVLPEYFMQGVGSSLMQYAETEAIKLGYQAIFLLGNPAYYPRFGYEPTYKYNIYHINDAGKHSDACMVKQLCCNYLTGEEGYVNIE